MVDQSTLRKVLAVKPECLSPRELEELAEDSSRKHPHLASCPRCQAELAMLKEFESSTPLPDEGAAVAWISSHLDRKLDQIKHPGDKRDLSNARNAWFTRLLEHGRGWWLAPVAAVAVIVLISAIFLRTKAPVLRADLEPGPQVYRAQEVAVIAPSGEVSKAPKELEWKPFAGAALYKVSVMEVDRVALWSGATNYTTLTIPDSARSKMLPGKPVLWEVTALDSQGRVLAVSQVQRFSIARKSRSSR
jgi:hypothetical protein